MQKYKHSQTFCERSQLKTVVEIYNLMSLNYTVRVGHNE